MKQQNPPGASRPDLETVTLNVSHRNLLKVLAISWFVIGILLLLLDYRINYASGSSIDEIQRLFNMTREDSLPSFFGVTLATFLAMTLWLVWAVERHRQHGRWRPLGWLVIAVWFTYMAIDDGSRLHERVGTAVHELAERGQNEDWGGAGLLGFPSYSWQVVYVPSLGLLALFTMYYLWGALKSRRAWMFVVLAMAMNVFAVGMDFMEGLDESHPLNLYAKIAHHWDIEAYTERAFDNSGFETVVHFGKTTEEFIEDMADLVLMLVFLDFLMRRTPQLALRFRTSRPDLAEAPGGHREGE